ncbi:hypothetical protein H8F24_12735 [Synechococcus sp. CBW1002]|uniref:hypothetical protein n=1 Tax=unclassified Synechococcus TaxID=2626047 RepID=UPI0018CD723F|nr:MULTISPECIES: hypothetical protein [unclassified Synechococcus]QPN58972.1 hypothetical protein H8F24_12735 [Synechococcus sp. CBW1002]QPN65686.1 hypothetical protein H8F26_12290 [Synechococcus sp. CBW1006]
MASIDRRLAARRKLQQSVNEAARPSSSASASQTAPSQDRLIHCRLHQEEVQAAERERQKRQSLWISISSQQPPGSAAYEQAKQKFEAARGTLERLIPERYRGGLPLEPDAIRLFSRCDPGDF